VQCPAFRVGRPPFDQAQGGPTATRGGTAPAAGEECWPLFCTGVRMLENLSRSARKRKKAQRCEVRNWASKAQRKSNIIQWIGDDECASERFKSLAPPRTPKLTLQNGGVVHSVVCCQLSVGRRNRIRGFTQIHDWLRSMTAIAIGHVRRGPRGAQKTKM
jgi:hypothetical protein